MIISASRRTDIPSFYFDWFLNRLKEGFALVSNPMNHRQVSRVDLRPAAVDCVVFWTKNPAPMLDRLDRLDAWPFYVQFTINPYGPDMERNLPDKNTLVDTFKRLADAAGPDRMVWRYSPVLVNTTYTEALHLDFFGSLADRLRGYTDQCNLSFLDMYAKIERPMAAFGVKEAPLDQALRMAAVFKRTASESGITVSACGKPDLSAAGVSHARCVDPDRVTRITGRPVSRAKDPGQRGSCVCAKSADVGAYHTCLNGCMYCYANHSPASAKVGFEDHHPDSPMLRGYPRDDDVVTPRGGGKAEQLSLWG